jgi:tetratricopeptide (TPR) repeat protein
MRAALVCIALAACSRTPAPKSPTDSVKADILRAEDAEKARNHDDARRYYEQAVADATDPASKHIAHREYGETLATWGEVEDAKLHLEASIAAIDSDPIAWQMLGIVRVKLGDTSGAFAALEKSKALAPKAWIPRRDLAVLHWKLGHRDQALAEYKDMLTLDLPDRLREKVEWAIGVLSKPEPPSQPSPQPPPQPPADPPAS